jgi:solute:Na+ symporter, SSS family
MHRADAIVMAAYFATMITVGIWYSRLMKSTDMYFAGGKQLSWWLGGVSLLMSYVSALSILVYAGLGFRYGLVALTLYWSSVPAVLVTTWLFAQRWRRAGVITPTEFLKKRFSPLVQQVLAWSGVPLKVIDEGLKIVAIGIFVSAALNVPAWISMSCAGATIIVYATLGGLWAVVVTDFIQFVLVSGAVILLLPLTLQAAGGYRHFRAAMPAQFFAPVHEPFSWVYVGSFLVLNTISLSGNWSLIQKFYSVRTDREARQVGWLASALFLLLPPFWIVTGMLARSFIPSVGIDPQTVYARVSKALLPPGILGMMIAALFAATMSVLSSGYNVISSVLTIDVYRRLIRPQAPQPELVLVGRILTIVIGTIALAIGLGVAYFHWTIFDTMVAAFGFFLPPTVLPMLGGLLSRRLSSGGALAGFAAGILIGLGFLVTRGLFRPSPYGMFDAMSLTVPAVSTALVLVLAASWFPSRGYAAEVTSEFFAVLGQPAVTVEKDMPSPSPIAGLVIGVMGLVLSAVGLGIIPRGRLNVLTLSVGAGFLTIGSAMTMGSRWFTRRGKARIVASQTADRARPWSN